MAKTNYTLLELRALQPLLKYKGDLVKQIRSEEDWENNVLIRFVSNEFPIFYFEVKRYKPNSELLEVISKPGASSNITVFSKTVPYNHVADNFNYWLDILNEYEELDDPENISEEEILQQSEDEFYEWFELVDDDAETKSYDFKTQLLIDKIADDVINAVQNYKGDIEENDKEYILEEANNLKKNQTRYTKKEVVKRISKIWARTKKVGLELFKEAVKDLVKDGLKSLIRGDFMQYLQ